MDRNLRVAVANITFSKNVYLRSELSKLFSQVKFNDLHVRLDNEELANFISDSEILIMGLELLNSDILDKCPNLKYIFKYGVGIDNIDFQLLNDYNIKFFHEVGVNRMEVAEFALSQILNLSRNISYTNNLLKLNKWVKDGGKSLEESTIGIIGCGNIGSAVCELLVKNGCKSIYGYDIDSTKYYSLRSSGVNCVDTLEELCSSCDIISIHVPGDVANHKIYNSDFFNNLKENVKLVNISRGSLVDMKDLLNYVQDGKIHSVALDVYDVEPFFDKNFLNNPRFICTPHIAGNSILSVTKMGDSVLNMIKNTFNF